MNKRIAAVTATACMLFVSVMIPAVSAEGTTDIGAQNQVKAVAYSDALDKLDYKGIRVGGLSRLSRGTKPRIHMWRNPTTMGVTNLGCGSSARTCTTCPSRVIR